MDTNTAMKLETIYGEPVVLEGAAISGVIKDLLSQVTVRQTYRNNESQPIEAVYTFPMPVDAVLLNMTVQIGERTLRGQVMEKQAAETRYEEAITDGDSAMMLQQVEAGMYTANVGNIGPGEKVSLEMCYTTRHELRDGSLRFRLPTVIAPRYGDYQQAGFEEHQIPQTSLEAENRFSINLQALGGLAAGTITSPSHRIETRQIETGVEISLGNQRADMDRDIIIMFQPHKPLLSCAYLGNDLNEQHAVMAFFTPLFNPVHRERRHIKLVLDCSGSMGGEKIERSRAAAMAVLNDLEEGDYFNITLFGSSYESVFPAMAPATPLNLQQARRVIRQMSADMGGTEMAGALDHVHKLVHPNGQRTDVLLVTDGEVTGHQSIIDAWRVRESRVFTVGIGNQVSEVLLLGLAEATQGVCELVVLNEKIEQTIVRQFKRIGQPQIQSVDVQWPDGIQPESVSLPRAIFANDAFWINAQFRQVPAGKVSMSLALATGETLRQEAVIETFQEQAGEQASTVARLAASDRIARVDDEKLIQAEAVAYQLMSAATNYLFVDVRAAEEKFSDLPEVRKVNQMAPSGWDFAAASVPMVSSLDMDMVETMITPSRKRMLSKQRSKLLSPTEQNHDLDDVSDSWDDDFSLEEVRILDVPVAGFLTDLAREYMNPQAMLSETDLGQRSLPDKLAWFLGEQQADGVMFMDALVQALFYLAERHKSELDKQTNRFYTKLAKLHKPVRDLQLALSNTFDEVLNP